MKFSEHNTARARWLALDVASQKPCVAVVRGDGQRLALALPQGGALEGVRAAIQTCLDDAGVALDALDGFLFCEGPGSILSVRLAAMMLRVWKTQGALANKPVFAWRTLPLLARAHAVGGKAPAVVTTSRRGFWCVYRAPADWSEVATAALAPLADTAALYVPQRKQWETPPAFLKTVVDNPALDNPALLFDDALLERRDTPDAFVARAPDYRRWTA